MLFGDHFACFDPLFSLEVDDIEPESCNKNDYSRTKFHENRIKTIAVIVPEFFRTKWRP